MSSSIILKLNEISENFGLYVGIIMFILGIIGNLLTIIIFISLETFRKNSCSYYLMIMSIFNIANLIGGLLTRIIITGFSIDLTIKSSFYCGFRWYYLYFSVLISFTMICLSTIDQYFSTSLNEYYRRLSNIKNSHRLSIIFIIFWVLLGIPYTIYFKTILNTQTNQLVCTSINKNYFQYHIYVYIITLAGILPTLITIIFGYLSYINIKTLSHRRLPIIRRELDKQLTKMILIQVIHNVFTTIPYVIMIAIIYSPYTPNDQLINSILQFILLITIYLYYLNFSVRFFIF